MIGVIPQAGQENVVEEFFELFKTPWELFRAGQAYDVVIVAADAVPEIDAALLVICGPGAKTMDARLGVALSGHRQGAFLTGPDVSLPIYSEMCTFTAGSKGQPCATAGPETVVLRFETADSTVLRLGYDLFEEVRFLLLSGQPIEHASIPTLDLHIKMLRNWILQAGLPLLEIPPTPAGHSFAVCLTHDIDFVGIRRHLLDHSMWGFVFRATLGALRNFFRGRLSAARLFRSWLAAASLPLVYAGWVEDFWEPFHWYLEVEKGLPATYFLIPFKRRAGENVPGPHASRRATSYDVSDLPGQAATLRSRGCELGVHGIDSWHSVESGRNELAAIAAVSGDSGVGVRMHWLLRDTYTSSVLEQAGYSYDSTFGYNETVGYRAGTSQVFQPLDAKTLLELPLHIQDGALFFPQRLDLSEPEAEKRCQALVENVSETGGVLTVLWHDRSHGPERFWGEFYIRLVQMLKSRAAWFGTAAQLVAWFRKRRQVRFEQVEESGRKYIRLRYQGEEIQPPLNIRIYAPAGRLSGRDAMRAEQHSFKETSWNGDPSGLMELHVASQYSSKLPDIAVSSFS